MRIIFNIPLSIFLDLIIFRVSLSTSVNLSPYSDNNFGNNFSQLWIKFSKLCCTFLKSLFQSVENVYYQNYIVCISNLKKNMLTNSDPQDSFKIGQLLKIVA